MTKTTNPRPGWSLLNGGGEMGELTRRFDWEQTSLGLPDNWPQSLRTTLSILLNSKFPMFLWWGPDLLQFYNDAYRPSLGTTGKHPLALGQKAVDCWPEIWPVIGPLIEQVLAGGEATWSEDQLIPIYRNGQLEDVYWTFSYSPVQNESGLTGGVLVVCQETTATVNSVRQLAQKDEQNQRLFKEAPVAISIMSGPDYTFELANDAYLTLVGRIQTSDLVGKPLLTALPELAGQGFEDLLATVLRTGEPFVAHEQPATLVRGGRRETAYFNFVYKPLYGANGQPDKVFVVATEVTEPVLARQQLEASERRLQTIFDQAPVAIGILRGPQFVIDYANPTFCRLLGRTVEQLLNKGMFEAVPELTGQGFEELLMGVLQTGKPFVGSELPSAIDRNGEPVTIYWNFVYTPLYEDGQITGVTAVAMDVSEQVAARQEVELIKRRLQTIFEQAPVAIGILRGPQFVVDYANPTFCRLLGRTGEQLLGKPLFEALPETAGQGFEESLTGVLQTGTPVVGSEVPTSIDRNGEPVTIYWNFTTTPLYEDGQITGLTVVATDVSEQVAARHLIERSEQSLREADRRKDEFLAMLGHELRNPLAPIRNTLQVLQRTGGQGDLTPKVALMTRQVNHLIRMVDDLLDVSRINQGKIDLRPERIDLSELVAQAVAAVRPLYDAGGLALTVVPSVPSPIYLLGDATRLTQVITNLLINAARYTQPGGHVRVSVKRAGEEALLRVKDDGIGLAAESLNTIFEMFVQVKTALDRPQGGLGLGLTVVKRLVEGHGGRVAVQSAGLGQGSEFSVYLPALAETPAPQPAVDAGEKAAPARRRVLVVDDNEDAAYTLTLLLKLTGYEAHARYGGREAIAAAESLRPAVVVLDIGMPVLDGYATCRLIREQPWGRSMVLIALTGYGQEDDKRRTQEAGFDDHLVKPVDVDVLIRLMDKLLAGTQG